MDKNTDLDWLVAMKPIKTNEPKKHERCLITRSGSWEYDEWECGYDTIIDCEDCRYGSCGGRKKPDAKCNLNKHEIY